MRRAVMVGAMAVALILGGGSAAGADGPTCDAAGVYCQQTGAGCLVSTGAGGVLIPGTCP